MAQTLIGKYKILNEIGHGGMGIVYRGEQVSLGREVAIKTLPLELANDQEYLKRIENEAKIMAKFSHPNIVYIHDRVRLDDAIYIIMEYFEGVTLADQLRNNGPYALKEAAKIIIRVAVALEYAHSKGIIHRDIKPSNIMIRQNHIVKVTDFGIAKWAEGSDPTRLGLMLGTRNYMSPEQAKGIRDIDGRSDIYSLGVVFYQMLTGKLPSCRLPDELPLVPQRYYKIILKCLAEDRCQRYQTAKDLINALDEAKGNKKKRKQNKKAGRLPNKKGKIVTGVVVSVILVVFFVWQVDPIKKYFISGLTKKSSDDSQFATVSDRAQQTRVLHREKIKYSNSDSNNAISNDKVEIEKSDVSASAVQSGESLPSHGPMLRAAADRTKEFLSVIHDHKEINIRDKMKHLFALKTGVIEQPSNNSNLLSTIKTLFDQMEMVRRVDQGGCDLLVVIDSTSQNLLLNNNLTGDDKKEKFKENYYFRDVKQLSYLLETIIQRYYCFSILRSMELLKPIGDGYAAAVTFNGGNDGMFRVGDSIEICLNSRRDAYSMLLSVNFEGIYMLFPQIREEHAPLILGKPFCTDPMAISPPTGNELVVAILFADKTLLPIDRYLAAENQVIFEPAWWAYDLNSSNNAVEYCEQLFTSLYNALPDKYSVKSQFLRTYN
jgi:serine/threonine protein kinase